MASRRIIVAGGLGFFGRVAVERLRALGHAPLTATRGAQADLCLDVEHPESLRDILRAGDIVLDAVGPYQERTTTLIEAAIEIGCDVIDINDSLAYAERVIALAPRIEAAGIRVLCSASSVSATAACAVRLCGVDEPVRVTGILAPAKRRVVNRATALSLLRSVGQPIRVLRDGKLVPARGWGESRRFQLPAPLGNVRAFLFESADSVWLPHIWPSVRTADFYIHANTPGFNGLLKLAAHAGFVRRCMERLLPCGAWYARRVGSRAGGLGYEIEDGSGRVVRYALLATDNGYMGPVLPAVLAAHTLLEGSFAPHGLVAPDRHVDPAGLADYMRSLDFTAGRLDSDPY